MTEEFVARFAQKVASFFPFRGGETFEDYVVRARAESDDRRALIAACIVEISEQFAAERQLEKTAWIAAARLRFDPGARRPCVICGKYEGLTEAHHIVPLGVQFDAGGKVAIQDFDWLCPTHHAAQHFHINSLIRNISRSIPGMPAEESDVLHRLGTKFVDLFTMLPGWRGVRQ